MESKIELNAGGISKKSTHHLGCVFADNSMPPVFAILAYVGDHLNFFLRSVPEGSSQNTFAAHSWLSFSFVSPISFGVEGNLPPPQTHSQVLLRKKSRKRTLSIGVPTTCE